LKLKGIGRTDGKNWSFYFIKEMISEDEENTGYELFISKSITTDTDDGIATVMGIFPIQFSDLITRIASSSLRRIQAFF
jgi:hypothetical protein